MDDRTRRVYLAGIMNDVIRLADNSDTSRHVDVDQYVNRVEGVFKWTWPGGNPKPYLPEVLLPDDYRAAQVYHSVMEYDEPSLEEMRVKIVDLINFMHENDLSYGETARMIMDNVFLHKP